MPGPEGRILRVNARLLAWIGKSAADLEGALISDIFTLAGRMYYETHLGPLLRMQGFFDEIALELAGPGKERLPVIVNGLERRDEARRPAFHQSDGLQGDGAPPLRARPARGPGGGREGQ